MKTENQIEILYVEDNKTDLDLALRSIEWHIANKMYCVKDGEKALEFLYGSNEGYKNLKVIFLDFQMPKINGLEVLKELKANQFTKHIPVVMLSSSVSDRLLLEAYDLGVSSFIVKPDNISLLIQMVADAGSYWLKVNKMPSAGNEKQPVLLLENRRK